MTDTAIKLVEVPCPVCQSTDRLPTAAGRDFEYATSQTGYRLYKCQDCGIVYLSPRPDISELSKIYPPEYNPFNFHKIHNPIVRWGRTFVQRKKVNYLKKLLSDDASIIDVGCGSGSLLLLMQEFGSKEWQLYGNDFNSQILGKLQSAGIETLIGRFEEIDTNLHFDAVILNQAIEHFDCPAAVVNKVIELLQPGGIIVIETPSTEGFDAIMFEKRHWGGYHIPRHWSIFSDRSIKHLLNNAGFDQINISYMVSPSFWIQSFHHYFREKNWPKWWVDRWVVRNPLLLAIFTLIDTLTIIFHHPTSNMRVIAIKTEISDK